MPIHPKSYVCHIIILEHLKESSFFRSVSVREFFTTVDN